MAMSLDSDLTVFMSLYVFNLLNSVVNVFNMMMYTGQKALKYWQIEFHREIVEVSLRDLSLWLSLDRGLCKF